MPYTLHQRDRHHAHQWRECHLERDEECDEARRVLGPYIPEGCDQQGRYPPAVSAIGWGAFIPAFLALGLVCLGAVFVIAMTWKP
jgi:hypothetical protein